MATSAASAQSWINEKNPSDQEIKNVIDKLEKRIEQWEGDEDSIQGSIDAVLLLQSQLDREPEEPAAADLGQLSTQSEASLDSSSLIPESQPIELEQSIKQATFAALKAQLNKEI